MLIKYNGEMSENITSTSSCSACAKRAGKHKALKYMRSKSYYFMSGQMVTFDKDVPVEVPEAEAKKLLELTTIIDGVTHPRFSIV